MSGVRVPAPPQLSDTTLFMKFVDFSSQYKKIETPLNKRLQALFEHEHYINGSEIDELEQALCKYTSSPYCITSSSGTTGLQMILMALGIGPDDIVITVPFTFIATAESIKLVGADVVFSDIDSNTLNMCPNKLSATIHELKRKGMYKRLKAVIAVDLFGNPADYQAIRSITDEHNIYLVRDAAQSFGALYQNKHIADYCDASSVSFYPTKTLSCYGDGGAIFTHSSQIAEQLYAIRSHGLSNSQPNVSILGLNGRFDTIQAIVILEKLKIYQQELDKRQQIAHYYTQHISSSYEKQQTTMNAQSTYSQYAIICQNQNREDALLECSSQREEGVDRDSQWG